MSYFVFEDLVNATQVKIHQQGCGFIGNNSTETTKWHECSNLEEAESKAKELASTYGKGWKMAECCLP